MGERGRQRGLTIIGFILVAAVVMIFVVVGARTVPAYVEYFSVQKSLEKSLAETRDPSVQADVRKSFDKFVATDYIESVSSRDVEVTKQGGEITATAVWTRKLHLVGNVFLFLEFEASARK